jgi:2,3-bisphosphoglycerate-dependent phosphoglycerate mutase
MANPYLLLESLRWRNNDFNYDEFIRIKDFKPFIVCMSFDGENIIEIEEFEVK